MVQIPRSRGVLARPTTEVGRAAPSIADTQIIPQAISGLGATIANIGGEKMAQERMQARKEQEAFEASSYIDYRTKLKSFDNQQKIRLAEAPNNTKTVNTIKQQILDDRQAFESNLRRDIFGDNKRLLGLADRESKTSLVDLEFSVDRELLGKKKDLGQRRIFDSISSLNERAAQATSEEDFIEIQSELSETLQTGLSSNLISIKDVERQEKILKEARKARQLEVEREQSFNDAIGGTLLLDPKNKDDQQLIDDNFDELLIKADNPEEIAEQIAINTGIVPKKVKSFWSSQLFAGDPSQKVRASETITDLIEANPSLQSEFGDPEKALAAAINNRITAGLTAEQAVEFAEEDLNKNKSLERKLREGQFNQEFGTTETSKKAIDAIDDIKGDLEGESGFFFEADVPEQMAIEVRRLARDFYLNQGVDMDTALDIAKTKVTGEWAITGVGEKRYQRYAPEKFYGINGVSNKWIENQASLEVKKLLLEDTPMKEIRKDISLEAIPDTVLTGKPSYYVFRENEFGAIDMVLDNDNIPLVYTPDFTKTEEYKKDIKRRDKLRITKEKAQTFEEKRDFILKQRRRQKELVRASNTLSGISR